MGSLRGTSCSLRLVVPRWTTAHPTNSCRPVLMEAWSRAAPPVALPDARSRCWREALYEGSAGQRRTDRSSGFFPTEVGPRGIIGKGFAVNHGGHELVAAPLQLLFHRGKPEGTEGLDQNHSLFFRELC